MKLIAYATEGDVWIYDLGSRRRERLTNDREDRSDTLPRFRTNDEVSYLSDGEVHQIDLRTRTPSVVVAETGPIFAYDWRDAGTIAYVAQRSEDASGAGSHELVVRSVGGGPRLTQGLGGPRPEMDREVSPEDEVFVDWSADGERVLVGDTLVYPATRNTLVVTDKMTRIIVRQFGTQGRWRSNSEFVYRDWSKQAWSALDVETKGRRSLAIRKGRLHPTVLREGTLLVLDDSQTWKPGSRGCVCTLYLYDFSRGVERQLAADSVWPVWLDGETVLATSVRGCRGDECGTNTFTWVSLDTTNLISIATAEATPLEVSSSVGADARR